jgi:hypothetical protein
MIVSKDLIATPVGKEGVFMKFLWLPLVAMVGRLHPEAATARFEYGM